MVEVLQLIQILQPIVYARVRACVRARMHSRGITTQSRIITICMTSFNFQAFSILCSANSSIYTYLQINSFDGV